MQYLKSNKQTIMKTIKIFATLFCMITMMSVNAQTTTKVEAKPKFAKKVLNANKPVNVPKAKVNTETDAKKDATKSEIKKEPVKIDNKDAKVGTKPADTKTAKPSDKTKMKQIGRPVKVSPK